MKLIINTNTDIKRVVLDTYIPILDLEEDISSIKEWDRLHIEQYAEYLKNPNITILADYGQIRTEITKLCIISGWDNLRLDDKIVAAHNYAYATELISAVISDAELKQAWANLLNKLSLARKFRWNHARIDVSRVLSVIDSSDFGVSTAQLSINYVDYQITSKEYTGKVGLYDYLNGYEEYATNGFPSKSYYSEELRDDILNTLNGGHLYE